MEITKKQFARIEHCLHWQRGNVILRNLEVVNAMLFVAEHGCKWRGLPKRFGTPSTHECAAGPSSVFDKMF